MRQRGKKKTTLDENPKKKNKFYKYVIMNVKKRRQILEHETT
jgi:hypothetical protein